MESRLSLASLWQSSFFTSRIEGVEIIQSQAATEPTAQGIYFGVREELQSQVAPLQNHPAFVTPSLREPESCVETGSGFKVARGKIRRSSITHFNDSDTLENPDEAKLLATPALQLYRRTLD
jgi:hypothetical protein